MHSQRGNSSVGRARPCQGRGREFKSRFPLHKDDSKGHPFFVAGRVGRPGRVSVPPPRAVPQPVFNRHQIDLRPIPQNNSQADPRGSPQHGHHALKHLSGILAWQSVLLTELRHGTPAQKHLRDILAWRNGLLSGLWHGDHAHRYSRGIPAWRDGHPPVLRHDHHAHRCLSGILTEPL